MTLKKPTPPGAALTADCQERGHLAPELHARSREQQRRAQEEELAPRPARPAIVPAPRHSQPLSSSAAVGRALQSLRLELLSFHGRDDHEVLGVPPDADLTALSRALFAAHARYDASQFAAYGSQAVIEAAAAVLSAIEQAHRRLRERHLAQRR